jgi:hypothetical protein
LEVNRSIVILKQCHVFFVLKFWTFLLSLVIPEGYEWQPWKMARARQEILAQKKNFLSSLTNGHTAYPERM